MNQTTQYTTLYPVRMLRKDVGVAIVVLLALGLGFLLKIQVEMRTRVFQDKDSPFRMAYPATWNNSGSLLDTLIKVEDPMANSAFKTTLTVQRRELDTASPVTLQTLVDRRVAQHGSLTGYHFIANNSATVDGVNGASIEYAYVTQPIDTPRRASLPVVVHANEYIVATRERVYYITLAAPENEYASVKGRFDDVIRSVHLQ